ncbi:hypothetical protein [Ferrovibrio terrae]|uniref:hypothetical protein n=1 Tax=Ferrovibrio terrae TaxID=2594003 RepID=UPI0031376FFD
MSTTRLASNVFSRGQLDPDLWPRSDLEIYYKAAQKIENLQSLPLGGVALRPGLVFVADLGVAADMHRIKEFVFDPTAGSTQSYLHVFVDGKLWVYHNDVRVAELVTPWTAALVGDIDYAQSLDTMIVTHKQVRTRRVMRRGRHDAWVIENAPFENIPKFEYARSFPNMTLTLAALSGGSVAVSTNVDWFEANDVGATVRADTGQATVTAVADARHATLNISVVFVALVLDPYFWSIDRSTSTTKAEDVWSDRRGWAGAVALHDGRTYLGGSLSRPSTIWGSFVEKAFDFKSTTDAHDDEAVEATLSENNPVIRRMRSIGGALWAMTSAGEYSVTAVPVTPKDFAPTRQTDLPSAMIAPAEVEGSPVFVRSNDDGADNAIYELVRSSSESVDNVAYEPVDIAQHAGNLIRTPIQDQAYAPGSDTSGANHLFEVNGDGTLAVFNTRRKQNISAWTLYTSAGQFKRVAVVGGRVYLTATHGGRLMLLRLDRTARLDFSKTVTSEAPATNWPGFNHLAGLTVHVYADGKFLGPHVVSVGGAITTAAAYSNVHAGLPFTWRLKLLPEEARTEEGTIVGRRYRVVGVNIKVRDTAELYINGKPVDFRRLKTTNDPIPLFSGHIEQRLLGWSIGGDADGSLELSGPNCKPVTIQSVVREIKG